MTFRQWEKQLKKALKGLPAQEKQTVLDYYRELYGDKLDAGCTPDEAVAQFGLPADCAQNILTENEISAQISTPKKPRVKTQRNGKVSVHSVSYILGMVFLTLFLIIPLYACLLAAVVSFASVAQASVIVVVASLLLTVLYPIYLCVYGASWAAIVANAGMTLAAAGICVFLFIGFFFATKYTVIWSVKLFKRIYCKEV